MPTPKPLSREIRICLAIWRKAYDERNSGGELVTINCPSHNAAIAIRQSMYRAIRPFREGKIFDEDLRLASELFVVGIEKGEKPRLVLKPRSTLDALEAEMGDLGLTDQDLLLAEERLMGQSLNEFLEPEEGNDAERSTPFYTR